MLAQHCEVFMFNNLSGISLNPLNHPKSLSVLWYLALAVGSSILAAEMIENFKENQEFLKDRLTHVGHPYPSHPFDPDMPIPMEPEAASFTPSFLLVLPDTFGLTFPVGYAALFFGLAALIHFCGKPSENSTNRTTTRTLAIAGSISLMAAAIWELSLGFDDSPASRWNQPEGDAEIAKFCALWSGVLAAGTATLVTCGWKLLTQPNNTPPDAPSNKLSA
jgi:hypothetical protein